MAGPWRCYAAGLGGCSAGPSREHYISAAVLAQLGDFKVEGMPGVPDGLDIGVNSLATKILCQSHNRELSELDRAAGQVFQAIVAFDQELTATVTQSDSRRIPGEFLERWLLKVAFGISAANRRVGRNDSVRQEDRLLPVLFGRRDFPRGWGFHVQGTVGDRVAAPAEVAVKTWVVNSPDGRELWGLTTWLRFVPLTLALGRPRAGAPTSFRPSSLTFRDAGHDTAKEIRLTWHDGRTHEPFELTRSGTMEGYADVPDSLAGPFLLE